MKGKFIRVLIALVLVLSFSLVTAVPAAGVHTPPGTIYVDAAFSGAEDGGVATPFNTIGEAITHASAGDTISVVAGTYTEDLTVNKANLTIQSTSGAASTSIQLVTGVGIDIQGGASGFTLGGASGQGFTISPHATATTFDIQLANAPSGVTISYNTIDTTGDASMGISVGAAGATGLTISNNTFTAEDGDGSIWGPKIINVTVSNNTFTGPSTPTSGYAVEFAGVTGTSTISGNTITNYGMGVAIFHGEGTSGLTISGNTISGSVNGIRLGQYSPTTDGNMTTVTITQNTLTSNTIALRVDDGANVKADQFTINNNNISGSTTYGLKNDHASLSVTAESNWWGDASGPTHSSNSLGTGDEVTDNVDFMPWLDAAYPGGQPAGLVTNTTQSTGYGTIQEAIDAANAGDTIVARDGTFTEDLTVNTANLTLRSQNGKAVTTIQLVTGVGIDIQGGADNFKLGGASGQGFTIDDGGSTTFDIQLANAPSGVTISYNTIDTVTNASMGISIGAAGASGLTISNNTISTGTGDGAIWGPNVANVTVSNNTLSGGSYGVQFSGVTGTSTISSNTISSFIGSGAIVISNGAGTSGLTITGNTISSSSNGIYFNDYTAQGTPADMTTVTVTYNTITGSTTDAIKIGNGTYVLASNFVIRYNAFIGSTGDGIENLHTTEQVTAEWNWWDATTGPDDDGNKNPYYVEAAAASAETVSTNVDFTPWMMHTSLVSGWNIYSTPIASGTSTDTISEALDLWTADSSKVTSAYYFNGSSQAWAVATSLTPLVPIYLNMSAAATIDVLMSTSNTAPPAMTVYQGWNLVGPAELYDMDVDDALGGAYWGTGAANLVGYSQVLSPGINQTAVWTHLRGVAMYTGDTTPPDVIPTEGYWVYMVNQGTVGGFTYTPITPLP